MQKSFRNSAGAFSLFVFVCFMHPDACNATTEAFEGSSVYTLPTGYGLSSLAGIGGAPNMTPALPVNQGGDLELRFTTPFSFSNHGLALSPFIFSNVAMDGYLGFGSTSGFGDITGGFALRSSGGIFGNRYVASILLGPGDPSLYIARADSGIIRSNLAFATLPTFDSLHENYHLFFAAHGNDLTASVARVTVVNGVLTETTVAVLSAFDSVLSSGQVGMYSFVGTSANGVFYDDISISEVPEPTSLALLGLGLCSLWAYRSSKHS